MLNRKPVIRKAATAAAGLALTFAGTLLTGTTAHATVLPHAFGWCDGQDPAQWGDGETVASATADDNSIVELRYSPSTQCIWARVVNSTQGDTISIHRQSDGAEAFATVESGTDAYTTALDDAGVTSFAQLYYGLGQTTSTASY